MNSSYARLDTCSYARFAAIVYSICLFVFLASPHYILPGAYTYPLFLLLCVTGFTVTSRIENTNIVVVLPLFLMVILVSISHWKGILFGFPIVYEDISDYLKFSLPALLFLSMSTIYKKNNIAYLKTALKFVIFLYCGIYVVYLIFGADVLYRIQLGRGVLDYYRYGGVDINPNAYAAVCVALIVLSLALFKNKLSLAVVLTILLLSLISSQSRTNLIAFSLVALLYILLYRGRFFWKCVVVLLLLILVIVALKTLDLYWLTYPGRFDLTSDRSFNIRLDNSLEPLRYHIDYVGLFGVGPGRGFLDRLDTITYFMYFVRYGLLGVLLFIFIHFWLAGYVVYNIFFSPFKRYVLSSFYYPFLLSSAVFPIYVLISNISNEKWIDLKFISLWIAICSLSHFYTLQAKYSHKEAASWD